MKIMEDARKYAQKFGTAEERVLKTGMGKKPASLSKERGGLREDVMPHAHHAFSL